MKKYIVRDGDTLMSISQVTGVRLSLLESANPHLTNPNVLPPGEVISVPELEKGSGVPEQATPVREGNVSNGPKSAVQDSASRPPQAPSQFDPRMPGYFGLVWPHVVQNGESWGSIADAYQIPLPDLQQMNVSQAVRSLQPGDILYVPNVVTQVPVAAPTTPVAPPMYGVAPVDQPRAVAPYGADLPTPLPSGYYANNPFAPRWPSLGAWFPVPTAAYPSPYPAGPYAMFPGALPTAASRAADAAWRNAYGAAGVGFQDFDESSSLDSSWADNGAGEKGSHA